MKVFKHKEFEILIDEAKTAEYFTKSEIEQKQENRNFEKYVEGKMTDEEREFFASLSIDPTRINIEYAGYSKKENWNARINTVIIGEFISYPDSVFVTLDDVAENGIEILDGVEDNDIIIGHFQFHIYTPDEQFDDTNNNPNEIKISISVKDLPWLLDEKCDHSFKDPSKITMLLKGHFPKLTMLFLKMKRFIPYMLYRFRQSKNLKKALADEICRLKEQFDIDGVALKDNEVLDYKKQWVAAFLPFDADEKSRKDSYESCIGKGRFLWHLFSCKIIDSEENPTEKFEAVSKNNCVLIFETDIKDMAVKLSNAQHIKEKDIIGFCENIVGWSDFVITADDFSWTYSRTHEDGWRGPYFYKK